VLLAHEVLPLGTVHAAEAHPAEGATYLIGSRVAAKGKV